MRKTALGLSKSSSGTSALKERVDFTYSSWRGRNAVSELAAASSWEAAQCPHPDKTVPSTSSTEFQLSNCHRHQTVHNFLLIHKIKLNKRFPSKFHNVWFGFFKFWTSLLFLMQTYNQRRKQNGLRPTVTDSFSSLIAISIPALSLLLHPTDANILQATF